MNTFEAQTLARIADLERQHRAKAARVLRIYKATGELPFDPADFPNFPPERVLSDWLVPVFADPIEAYQAAA
jgi:hypothetical protein